MIGCLRGIILEKEPYQILLEICGIGYEIYMPKSCFYALPETKTIELIYTHFIVKEDDKKIFGFADKQKKIIFKELIKINGIGPKLALSILSDVSAKQFISIIENQEVNLLIKLPGIGKKNAERIILEMKNKFKNLSNNFMDSDFINRINTNKTISPSLTTQLNEACSALITLGYKPQEARQMINKVARSDSNCELLIRDALRASLRGRI